MKLLKISALFVVFVLLTVFAAACTDDMGTASNTSSYSTHTSNTSSDVSRDMSNALSDLIPDDNSAIMSDTASGVTSATK